MPIPPNPPLENLLAGISSSVIEEALRLAAQDPTLSRYEIGEKLGEGAHGVVFEAYDRVLQQHVALKIARAEVLASTELTERFKGDAVALNRFVYHPHIVRLLDVQAAPSHCFVATELCELGSLHDYLSELPPEEMLSQRWVADLIMRVAGGVQHVHSKSVYHRDLKPSNLLLTVDETEPPESIDGRARLCPKVADFGLAKIKGVRSESTAAGVRIGSLPYSPPEQALGDSARVGPASDVYALGAIMYELLTRRPPFSGGSDAELIHKTVYDDPVPPRSIRRDLHKDLQAICLKCLEKKPKNRYVSASELGNDLSRFLKGLPPLIPRPNLFVRGAVSRFKRHPVSYSLFLLLLASVLGTSLLVNQMNRGRIKVLLTQLDAAKVAAVPDVLSELSRVGERDTEVLRHLEWMYESDEPDRKLAGALGLRKSRPECEDYAFGRLLTAKPDEIEPIARVMSASSERVKSRLAAALALRPVADENEAEARDKSRANAAAALLHLEQLDQGLQLLGFAPDPLARSYLIHLLGPSGIKPRDLIDWLKSTDDPAVRRALLQSLGEVPPSSWTKELRFEAEALAFQLYELDDDPGVHGSAKWLLIHWGLEETLRTIDKRLATLPLRSQQRWRVSPKGLTFVRFEDKEQHRLVEVADSETTVRLFREFRPAHEVTQELCPTPDHPADKLNYTLAAEFCNWLSEKEGISRSEFAYRSGGAIRWEPVPGQLELGGYRVPTDREFVLFARAGTTTRRYHGNTIGPIMSKYVWCQPWAINQPFLLPCRLKPNDLGLFDVLGNTHEIGQGTAPSLDPRNQATLVGGRASQDALMIACDKILGNLTVAQSISIYSIGMRVCRTVPASPNPSGRAVVIPTP